MKNKFLFISMAAGLLFAGCQKEAPIQNPSTAGQVAETLEERSASASVSIHEQVGIMHNEYLEIAYSSLEIKINQIGFNALQTEHLKNLYNQNFLSDVDDASLLRNEIRKKFADVLSISNSTELQQYYVNEINNLSFSPEFKKWALEFYASALVVASPTDVADLIKTSMVNVTSLSGVEYDVALASVYTYQYSYEYWQANAIKWQNLVDPNGESNIDLRRSEVPAADWGGAVLGGAVGAAIGGPVTLGAATGPAWAVGAIVTGLGNSLYTAAVELYHWIAG